MKRIERIMIFCVLILLLTGCSSNTLKCTKKDDKTNSKITLKFNSDSGSVESLILNEKLIYDKLDAHIDLDYYDLKHKYSIFDNVAGVKYKVTENKSDISINLDVDYTILNDDNYSLLTISKGTTKDNANYSLSNIGYVCK